MAPVDPTTRPQFPHGQNTRTKLTTQTQTQTDPEDLKPHEAVTKKEISLQAYLHISSITPD